jgi:hypothetical protein
MILNFNWLIENLLHSKKFMVLRMGNVEATAILQKEGIYKQMQTNAGFYGDLEIYRIWKNDYIKALTNMDCHLDVVSCPSFVICGDVLTKLNIWKPTLAYMERIDFWINLLEIFKKFNKKICIVSYFANEMAAQYKHIKKIFTHTDLSGLKIRFVESWNTIRGNEPHKHWCDTLERLKKKIDKTDPSEGGAGTPSRACEEIYLVSCGCYGLPLCNYIKEHKNANSIYVGGLLQMLFGLKGSRWDQRPYMNKYYNDSWKYPSKKPKNAEGVEGWCYGNAT